MHHVQTLYLQLTDADCNVASVSEMVQQQLHCQETVIMVDAKGMEIVESPRTRGLYHALDIVKHTCVT